MVFICCVCVGGCVCVCVCEIDYSHYLMAFMYFSPLLFPFILHRLSP